MKATTKGAVRASVMASVRFCAVKAPSQSSRAKQRLMTGSSTVPAATPTRPIGN